MEDHRSSLLIAEVDLFDCHLACERRHGDVLRFTLGLFGGSVDHVRRQGEIPGLDLELLPGLHQLHQRARDAIANDSERKQGPDREVVSGHQPDPHHHRRDAGEVAEEFGQGPHGFSAHLELEVLADETAVAVLEIPAGLQLGVLGLDRLDACDRFCEVAVGVDALLHHPFDLVFHDRVGDQGQHNEQRHRAQGDQGEQRVKAEQHYEVEQAEAEIHQGGESTADQEIAQAVELVEVVGDAAHWPGIEEALGKPNQPIENCFSGVHVHAVGHAGEDQAAQS